MDFLNRIAPAIATIQLDMENQTSLGARYNTYLAPSQVSCTILNVAWCCRQEVAHMYILLEVVVATEVLVDYVSEKIILKTLQTKYNMFSL